MRVLGPTPQSHRDQRVKPLLSLFKGELALIDK